MAGSEAPALRKPPGTATPIRLPLPLPRQPPTLPFSATDPYKDIPIRPSRTTPCVSPTHPRSSPEQDEYLFRTHKIALDPAPGQERLLTQTADYARAAYNWALRCYKDGKKAGQNPTIDTFQRKWNDIKALKYPWGKDLSQSAAKYAIDALGHGIRAGKDHRRTNGVPRFHSRTRKNAFRIGDGTNRVRCEDQRIVLPAIGSVRMRHKLRFKDGGIVMVTIKREAGRWYACVTVRRQKPKERRHSDVVGVDVGIRNMAVSSDGKTYPHHPSAKAKRRQKHQERKVKRYAEQAARQLPGSARRLRTLRKLERARCRIRWRRDDIQCKAAADIVGDKRLIVVETLDVRGMREEKKGMSREITRAAMHGMQQKLAVRCEANGAQFMKARPDFPSTQLCSRYGRRQKMPLGKKNDT